MAWLHTTMDTAALRSAALLCFPCPPLPQLVYRESTQDTAIGSSHDCLAMFLSNQIHIGDKKIHDRRKERQQELENNYIEAMKSLFQQEDQTTDEFKDQVYELMSGFTREYIQSYEPNRALDIRFKHWSDVPKQSLVYTNVLDQFRGLVLLENRESREIEHLSYIDLCILLLRTFIIV